jgi:hypothetical protein
MAEEKGCMCQQTQRVTQLQKFQSERKYAIFLFFSEYFAAPAFIIGLCVQA